MRLVLGLGQHELDRADDAARVLGDQQARALVETSSATSRRRNATRLEPRVIGCMKPSPRRRSRLRRMSTSSERAV